MPKCKECGGRISLFQSINYSGFCRSCAQETREKKTQENLDERKRLIAGLGGEPIKLVFSIRDVAVQLVPLWLTIGDIFVTRDAVIYICLAQCQYMGKVGGGLGAALGGLAGGLAASVSNKSSLQRTYQQTVISRQNLSNDLGKMIMSQRYVVIPKDSIASVSATGDSAVRIEYSGGTLEFVTQSADGPLFKNRFDKWITGELASDAEQYTCPKCGFELSEPSWRCPKCYHEFESYRFDA
jgi:hypothetical protein